MKVLFALMVSTLMATAAFAHEGGHGTIAEGGKFGGITSPIVDKAQAGLGEKAKTLYKAELVRAASGKLSLYVFDKRMNLVDLSVFADEVDANLEVKKKGRFIYVGNFKLTRKGKLFEGQLPAVEYKPFSVDLYLMKGKQKLFVGFSNLD